MVIELNRSSARKHRGFLLVELIVAIGILAAVLLPLAFGQWFESNALRTTYQRAVAMELVDGELEILAAGEWRQFGPGRHEYPVHAAAAANLPRGQFTLTVQDKHLRLEWKPESPRHGRGVSRETEGR
jgi:hypothetical protein